MNGIMQTQVITIKKDMNNKMEAMAYVYGV